MSASIVVATLAFLISLSVLCSVSVSVLLLAVALSVIERELVGNWRKIVDALRFDPNAFGSPDATPAARRPALVTVRPNSARRPQTAA